jgi:hypothetical protein
MQPKGLSKVIEKWRNDVEGFFTLLTLEIWGRLFFQRESLNDITEKVIRLAGNATESTLSKAHATKAACV